MKKNMSFPISDFPELLKVRSPASSKIALHRFILPHFIICVILNETIA